MSYLQLVDQAFRHQQKSIKREIFEEEQDDTGFASNYSFNKDANEKSSSLRLETPDYNKDAAGEHIWNGDHTEDGEDGLAYYEDFSESKETRKDQVQVEGQSFFVNGHWLAELSPKFCQYFLKNNSLNNEPVFDGDSAEDVLELLRCIVDCPTRKPIDDSNVEVLTKMAGKYAIKSLHIECKKFVIKHLEELDSDVVTGLIEIFGDYSKDDKFKSILIKKVIDKCSLEKLESLRGHFNDNLLLDCIFDKMKSLAQSLERANLEIAALSTPANAGGKKRKLNNGQAARPIEYRCNKCKRVKGVSNGYSVICETCHHFKCTTDCPVTSCKCK